jgi:hypothetical protein
MAKRRTRRASPRSRTVTVRQAKPIVIRTSGGAVAKRRAAPRRRSGGVGGGDNLGKVALATGLGGAAVGWIEKTWPNLPSFTMVGKKGTIAIAAYFLRGKLPYAREVCLAASAIAGYEFGKEGRVSGEDDFYYDPSVQGIASQV